MKATRFYISRQIPWGHFGRDDAALHAVQIAIGGLEGAGPDMLVPEFKTLGEDCGTDDPYEALEWARAVCNAWQEQSVHPIEIIWDELATTDFDSVLQAVEAFDAEAEKVYDFLPKCPQCGGLMPFGHNSTWTHCESDEEFCSQRCAEKDYEALMREV